MKRADILIQCLLAISFCSGCRSLDRFDTHNEEAYCGKLLGQEDLSVGFEATAWKGGKDESSIAIESLRTAHLFEERGVAALMTSNDANYGPCSSEQKPLFARAPLRIVGKMLGDKLANLQLADDHEGDFVTFVDSSCSGSMVAVLSLIQNGSLELRLLRPAPAAVAPDDAAYVAPTPETTQRFGLFQLTKQKQGCKF